MIKTEELELVKYTDRAAAVRRQLERIGVTATEAAHLLRCDARTFRRYLDENDTPIPFAAYALLCLLKPVSS